MQANRACQPAEKANKTSSFAVQHRGSNLNVVTHANSSNGGGALTLDFVVDGPEIHYTGLDGDDFHSRVHWQAQKLVFEIVELERGETIRAQEIWELIDDGAKLRRIKREDGPDEHSTCTTTFAKDDSSPVKISLKKDSISVGIDGRPFTNLYMGADAHKPFLYPLRTASGTKVSRGYPVEPKPDDPTDHPHQRGLWVGSERLSGMDFWENDPSYHRPHMGTIIFKDVLDVKTSEDRGSFQMLSDWVSEHGESVVSEARTITFYAQPENVRMFDVDLHLRAKQQVTFEDHQDSVIGMRLAPQFDEKNGGMPVNAQGLSGEAHVRGQRSEWVDWRGNVDGEAVGVALFDHPQNYSFPTRWHVRSMGLLVASPFSQRTYSAEAADASKSLNAGEELHLKYRVLIHPQGTDVAAVYRSFASK